MKALILAAGAGRRFGARSALMPKCLVPVGGKSLLERYFEAFRRTGVEHAVVVIGYMPRLIRRECRRCAQGVRVDFVTNREYRRGSILSLRTASRYLAGGALIMDGDVFFPAAALSRLLRARGSAFLYDPKSVSRGEEMMLMARRGKLATVSKKVDASLKVLGEATGIFRLDAKDAPALKGILEDFYRRGVLDVEYEEAYTVLAARTRLGKVSVGEAFWSEMDFEEDWRRISEHLSGTDDGGSRSNPTRRSRPRSTRTAARVSKD